MFVCFFFFLVHKILGCTYKLNQINLVISLFCLFLCELTKPNQTQPDQTKPNSKKKLGSNQDIYDQTESTELNQTKQFQNLIQNQIFEIKFKFFL